MKDVIVVIFDSGAESSHRVHLQEVFCDYSVYYVSECEDPRMEALKLAREQGENMPCIVVSDNLTTMMSRRGLVSIIDKGLCTMERKEADLFYLFRYMDQCQMICNKYDEEGQVAIVRTYSPRGDDCILYAPCARNKIIEKKLKKSRSKRGKKLEYVLRHAVQDGELSAIATSPPVFDFDTFNSSDNKDYEKRCECSPVQLFPDEVDDGSSTQKLIALAVVIVIVIFVSWALIYLGPK